MNAGIDGFSWMFLDIKKKFLFEYLHFLLLRPGKMNFCYVYRFVCLLIIIH